MFLAWNDVSLASVVPLAEASYADRADLVGSICTVRSIPYGLSDRRLRLVPVLLKDLDWGERRIGGLFKAHYSFARAHCFYQDRQFLVSKLYRRVALLFQSYASIYVIAEDVGIPVEVSALHSIAARIGMFSGRPFCKIEFAPEVGRNVVIISNPKSTLDLRPYLEKL